MQTQLTTQDRRRLLALRVNLLSALTITSSRSSVPASFVALIVRPENEVERCAGAQCAKEPLASQLSVGIEAPHWMVAMAAVTATRAK